MRRSAAVYFTSYALSLLGKGIASVVLPLLVLDRTGDVLAAGLLATVSTAASAATGLFSGLLVDRMDRRAISVVSDVLAAASVAALPLVDMLWGLNMTWFLVLGVVGAMIRIPGMTAHETLLPALAALGPAKLGRLDRLVATRETVGNVLLLAGPGLGGLFVRVFGLSSTLLLATAVTSVLAAAATMVLDPRAGRVQYVVVHAGCGPMRRAFVDLADAWRFLAGHRLLLGATLISSMLVAVLSSLQSTLMPAYFTAEDLPGLTGLTLSAIAGGSIAGAAIYAATAGRIRRRVWFVVGMLAAPAVTTAPLAALASAAGLPAAGIALAVLAGVTAIAALLAPAFRTLDVPPNAETRDQELLTVP